MKVATFFGTLLLLWSESTAASLLYAVSDTSDQLFRIDTVAETTAIVGPLLEDASYSGLAWDYSLGVMWISDVLTETPGYGLGMVDPQTGKVTIVGDHGVLGGDDLNPINIMGLAWAPHESAPTGRVWAADVDREGLSYINTATGNAVFVGPWGEANQIRGLAHHPGNDTLYGLDPTFLYAIDQTTGAATKIGAHGISTGWAYIGLEVNIDCGVMYAVGGGDGMLYSVDLLTGASTAHFPTNVPDLSGLAWVRDGSACWGNGDGGGGGGGGLDTNSVGSTQLFVTDDATDSIWALGPWSGSRTYIGPAGIDLHASGLAYDPATKTLYVQGAIESDPGHLLGRVDVGSGQVTVIGEQFSNQFPISGLTYLGSTLLGSDSLRNALVEIDPTTGTSAFIGFFSESSGTPLNIRGLAFNATAERLYGISHDTLYLINPDTGTAAAIDSLSVDLGEEHVGLTWESRNGRLLASGSITNSLYEVNQLTGVASVIGPVGLDSPSGLSFAESALIYSSGFENGNLSGWVVGP